MELHAGLVRASRGSTFKAKLSPGAGIMNGSTRAGSAAMKKLKQKSGCGRGLFGSMTDLGSPRSAQKIGTKADLIHTVQTPKAAG